MDNLSLWTALAGIPPGSARPSLSIVLTAVVILAVVLVFNTFWEIKNGPPQP